MSDWRFHDYPLKGHWRYLPDDLSLQRGPTIVILQDGRRIRVPAMSKQNVVAPGDTHNAKDGEDMLKSLQALLSGKKQSTKPKAAEGFEMQRRAPARINPGRGDRAELQLQNVTKCLDKL